MKRGDITWVDFGPTVGGEIQKSRPPVIASNDTANRYTNRMQVGLVTSNTGKLYPCDAAITINGRPECAMADQLMIVSK